MGVVEKVSGAILIMLGVLLLTGQLTRLSAWLYQFTPSWLLI
jgi:cytochrome c-type biogenesis protein